MPSTKKIAISLPHDLLDRIETSRKAHGESRSAFIRRAIETLFANREHSTRVSAYIEGYRKQPESPEEVAAAETAAVQLLAGEPWE